MQSQQQQQQQQQQQLHEATRSRVNQYLWQHTQEQF